MIWREVESGGSGEHRHRLLMVEVKYRANPREYFQTYFEPFIDAIREKWPELYCVIVTDKPDEGCIPGQPPPLQDLHRRFPDEIYETTIREYEELAKQLFALLSTS